MRNPNRLDAVYADLSKLHKENFPDLRVGQFFDNFRYWLSTTGRDVFYIEDDYLAEKVREYINVVKGGAR